MYLCKCSNVEATLVQVDDPHLRGPLYMQRTGDPLQTFVDDDDDIPATEHEQELAERSGPTDDVWCPHCLTECTWHVCQSCGDGGEALGDIKPAGRVTCRNCGDNQSLSDLHTRLADEDYYVPDNSTC